MRKWIIAAFLGIFGLLGLMMTLCGMVFAVNGLRAGAQLVMIGFLMGILPGGLVLWQVIKSAKAQFQRK